jgi:hypothetical protein
MTACDDCPNGYDCAGDCSGTAFVDDCDVCGGNNVAMDCAGVCEGDALEDCAGVCDDDLSNDAVVDCAGECGGDAEYNCSGVCGGDMTGCAECDNDYDCKGDCSGTAVVDDCDVCSEGNTGIIFNENMDCTGDCDGAAIVDECNVCNGNGPEYECVERDGDIVLFCYDFECEEYLLDASDPLPTKFALSQNYPNPFNPVTAINFDIATNGYITLKIYDILGNHIDDLVSNYYTAGHYTVNWTGRNKSGKDVASGVYIYRLQHSEGIMTKKMILLR